MLETMSEKGFSCMSSKWYGVGLHIPSQQPQSFG